MLAIDKVFELVNNFDVREAHRRFEPAWAIVIVNSALEVEAVQKFKERPSIDEANALMASYPNCAYFYTHPGMYGTRDALRLKIDACAEAFRIP